MVNSGLKGLNIFYKVGSFSFTATQQTQNICITFIQRRPNVEDAAPTLYKCYKNVLCLLGRWDENMLKCPDRCSVKGCLDQVLYELLRR